MIQLNLIKAENGFKIDPEKVAEYIAAHDTEAKYFDKQLLLDLQNDIHLGNYCGDAFLLVDEFPEESRPHAYALVKDALMDQISSLTILEYKTFQDSELKFFGKDGFNHVFFQQMTLDDDEETIATKGQVFAIGEQYYFLNSKESVRGAFSDLVQGIGLLNKIADEYGVSAARNCIFKGNDCLVVYPFNSQYYQSKKITLIALRKYGNEHFVYDLTQVFGLGWMKSIELSPANACYSGLMLDLQSLQDLVDFPTAITPYKIRQDMEVIVKDHLNKLSKLKMSWMDHA